jgi:uncharacterized protein (DUF697 family)
MNKKKLPKAIRLPDDSGAVSGILELPEPSSQKAHESAEKAASSAHPDTVASESAKLDPGSEVKTPTAPSRALIRVAGSGSKRRRLAEAVVERHANYAALGGVIPLPIVNFGVVTAIVVRMVKALTDIYGVPFEHDRARAIVLGLIGGLTPTAASTLTASTLLYLVPGSNILGLAASSVTASACTRKIGAVFVEHFENGATLSDFPASGSSSSH